MVDGQDLQKKVISVSECVDAVWIWSVTNRSNGAGSLLMYLLMCMQSVQLCTNPTRGELKTNTNKCVVYNKVLYIPHHNTLPISTLQLHWWHNSSSSSQQRTMSNNYMYCHQCNTSSSENQAEYTNGEISCPQCGSDFVEITDQPPTQGLPAQVRASPTRGFE